MHDCKYVPTSDFAFALNFHLPLVNQLIQITKNDIGSECGESKLFQNGGKSLRRSGAGLICKVSTIIHK